MAPGLRKEDGTIDRTGNIGGQPFVLTTWNSDEVVEEALNVVKWWLEPDTQRNFAANGGQSGLVSVMAEPEYNDLRPWNQAHVEMLDWQRDVWHVPDFFELLTQQQEEFDRAITRADRRPDRARQRRPLPAGAPGGRWADRLAEGRGREPGSPDPGSFSIGLHQGHRAPATGIGAFSRDQRDMAAARAAARPEETGGFLAWMMAPERRGPLLVAPALIVLFVMNIFPLLWSFGLSFFNYRANRQDIPDFIGLRFYERVLSDPVVWERFQTTAIIVSSSVLLQLVIGFLLALMFARQFPFRRILLMLVLAPMMLSFVSVGVFFKLYYEPTFGLLSQAIRLFTGEPYAILASPRGAIIGIVVADAWMWAPFVMLLVLAGLVSVPKYLYEAAEIDRASWWRRFRTITFPYIRSLLLLAVLFRTIETFKLSTSSTSSPRAAPAAPPRRSRSTPTAWPSSSSGRASPRHSPKSSSSS